MGNIRKTVLYATVSPFYKARERLHQVIAKRSLAEKKLTDGMYGAFLNVMYQELDELAMNSESLIASFSMNDEIVPSLYVIKERSMVINHERLPFEKFARMVMSSEDIEVVLMG